jgi:hypothetical protein
MATGIFCSLVVLLTQAKTLTGSYDPSWASVQPNRILKAIALPNANERQNGEALVKAIEGLVPGDRLEIGTGTYSVNRLWDLSVSRSGERTGLASQSAMQLSRTAAASRDRPSVLQCLFPKRFRT